MRYLAAILLCFVLSQSAHAITRVEIIEANGSCTSGLTITFGTATTSGELIAVVASAWNNITVPTITDNKTGGSSTYTTDWSITLNSQMSGGTFHTANAASGITTVTMTDSGGAAGCVLMAAHYTGMASSPLDKNGGNPTASGTQATPYSYASTSVTTTQASEVLVGGVLSFVPGSGTCALAATGGWSMASTHADSNGDCAGYEEQIVSSTGSYDTTGTASVATSVDVGVGIVTFEASGGATVTPVNKRRRYDQFELGS